MNELIAYLATAIVAGTPILFATLGAVITEKVGNSNLGIEGMMLMGAVVGFWAGLITSNPIVAVVAAMIAGAFGALIYAFLTITLRTNQVVTGLTLTIFGSGFSNFIGKALVGQAIPQRIQDFFRPVDIPLLSKIPFLGPILFKHDLFVYFGYVITILIGIYLYNTAKGLNLRAVGENPAAADSTSININLYKYIHVLMGGALCGLGGAYLSLVYVHNWQDSITSGKGWIAVALVIFANWNPYKALGGSYLFGGLDIIGFRLQRTSIPISQYFMDMLPYLVTIIVLVVSSVQKSSKSACPKALGNAYYREER